jgi:LmbE family N-acetylglucosaminyl deacetylase
MPHAFKPKTVLAVGAHPDDIDFGCAGSVAMWAKEGVEVYYLIITDGSKGSADHSVTPKQLIKTRQTEQRAAAKRLGVAGIEFLAYEDGTLEVTQDLKCDIVKAIRVCQPDTVITFDPSMLYSVEHGFINHPDHRAAAQATLDAVFPLARDHLSFPELLDQGFEPHKVTTLLLMNFNQQNFGVNISETIEQKMAALADHASQMEDIAATQEMMRSLAAEVGAQYGYNYGEAFLKIDCPG